MTAKNQYLCGFTLDYYNATPTKKALMPFGIGAFFIRAKAFEHEEDS